MHLARNPPSNNNNQSEQPNAAAKRRSNTATTDQANQTRVHTERFGTNVKFSLLSFCGAVEQNPLLTME